MISYKGIDEATLIHGLYHGTGSLGLDTPAGLIDLMHGGARVTVDAVRQEIGKPDARGRMYFDYYRGRPLKVNLDTIGKEFDERLYDRDAGEGAAQRVVDALKAKS